MKSFVVDASVAYGDGTALDAADALFAPELIDLEVANSLRKSILRGQHDSAEASRLFSEWIHNRVQRVSHRDYLPAVWTLRHNITAYDAAYVALAMQLDMTLVTADRRLAKAAAVYCDVVTLD